MGCWQIMTDAAKAAAIAAKSAAKEAAKAAKGTIVLRRLYLCSPFVLCVRIPLCIT
jgi:hypothetical protein